MQKYEIALYIRLSIEDYKYDSLRIENQSLVLHEFVASMPESENAEVTEYIDNGYSGTNFERPHVQKLLELVRGNKIDYSAWRKPLVRRTGNRESGQLETAAPGAGSQQPGAGFYGIVIRSAPDPVRILHALSGSWQDPSERYLSYRHHA